MARMPNHYCVFCLSPVVKVSGKGSGVKVKKKISSRVIVDDKEGGCGNGDLLEHEISVMFIVRKVLSIPVNECEKLLETFGNPSRWLVICGECSKMVNESRRILERIRALEKELEGWREEAERRIVSSGYISEDSGKMSREGVLLGTTGEATTVIRSSFLAQRGKGSTAERDQGDTVIKEESEEIKVDYEDNYDFGMQVSEECTSTRDELNNAASISRNISEPASKICGKTVSLKIIAKRNRRSSKLQFVPQDKSAVFKCSYCMASFKNRTYLKSHTRHRHWVYHKSSPGKTLTWKHRKCPHCSLELRTIETFRTHCINEHAMIPCKKCPRVFPSFQSLHTHVRHLHENKTTRTRIKEKETMGSAVTIKSATIGDITIYQCLYCNYCNKKKRTVQNHMSELHRSLYQQIDPSTCSKSNSSTSSLKCDKCVITEGVVETRFSSLDDLNNHKVAAHGMVKCNQCDRVFLGIGYLDNHHRTLHSPETADPSYWIKVKNVDKSVSSSVSKNEKKLARCKFCQETFETRAKLSQHNFDKHVSEMFKCDKCTELFDTLLQLYSHKTKVHNEPNDPYKCSQCDYTNRSFRQVHIHRTTIHEKRARIVCELCSDTFSNEKYLKFHKANKHQIVPSDLNLQCNHCNKTFSTPAYLNIHIKTVHLGQWRYKCPQCDIGFNGKKQVDHHVKCVHEKVYPYKCTVEGCDKKYTAKHQLNSHMIRAHGPKDYKCSYCDYATADKTAIKTHEVKHTENGSFQCDHCGKNYTRKKCLDQHLRMTHKIRKGRGKIAKFSPFVASINEAEAKQNDQKS